MMKMKIKFLILAILLIPAVFGLEDTLVKTHITIEMLDSNTLRVTGENLEWAKTINLTEIVEGNTTRYELEKFKEDLEIILIRKFGNYTEVTELLSVCRDNLNYSDKWKECIELNRKVTIDNLNMLNNMVNKTEYDNCLMNNTNLQHSCDIKILEKSNELSEIKEQLETTKNQRMWLAILTLIGFGGSIYLFARYIGFGKKGTWKERDKPTDIPL